MKTKSEVSYTFKGRCDVCDDQRPVLKMTGMCAVCTFGEADSMWEWLDDPVVKIEAKATRRYIIKFLQESKLVNKKGEVDAMMAMLLHVDEHVLDRMEALL